MNQFLSSAHLKANAREQLLGHYGSAIGGIFIIILIQMILNLVLLLTTSTYTVLGNIFYYFFSIAFSLLLKMLSGGFYYMCLKISCGQNPSSGDVFHLFQHNSSKAALLSLFLVAISELLVAPIKIFSSLYEQNNNVLFLLLTSICLIVFAIILIIFSLTYSFVYFLLLDFPTYNVKEILVSSAFIMKGNRGRLFYLYVTFIPLLLLGLLGLGIPFFWIVPYIRNTVTNFYLDTMRKRNH